MLRLTEYEFTCGRCGVAFQDLKYDGREAGILVFRGEQDDSLAFVDANADPLFDEVSRWVANNATSVAPRDVPAMVWKLFASTCDPDSRGGHFKLPLVPRCPGCGTRAGMKFVSLERPSHQNVAELTHRRWNGLDAAAKNALLVSALQKP